MRYTLKVSDCDPTTDLRPNQYVLIVIELKVHANTIKDVFKQWQHNLHEQNAKITMQIFVNEHTQNAIVPNKDKYAKQIYYQWRQPTHISFE